jgi:Na+/phosphate symporter
MAPDHSPLAAAIPSAGNVALRVYTPSGPPEADEIPVAEQQVRKRPWRRLLVGLFALWLFLLAISVMKDGARPLGDLLQGSLLTDSVASTLGFGWLGAMLVMSGSPVAVASLTMLAGGAISDLQSLSMLTGSRLGASFVVLVVSFLYAIRSTAPREQRRASASIGIYCLILTAIVYVPALALGLPLLAGGRLDAIELGAPGAVLDVVDHLIGPAATFIGDVVPETPGLLFLAGLALLLIAVRLVDMALPDADDTAHLEEHTDWRSRKWRMFGVGSLVALVTMSVSVALTVLVPAVAKGYFRRRQVMPYIMGANITTLGDTLLVALLLENQVAVHVVLAELFTITLITLLLLGLLYRPLQERITQITDWILDERRRLAGFVAILFITPILLILVP